MDTEITEDELVAALFLAQETDENVQGALRTRDLIKLVGHNKDWVRERLREGIEAGKIEVVQIQIVDLAKRKTRVPAYRLKVKDESGGTDIPT